MMFKYAALISLLVVMGEGQRPPYAGTANRYPQVLPRFQEEEAAAAAAAAAAAGNNANVGNRVGEGSSSSSGSPNNVGLQAPNGPVAAGAAPAGQAPAVSTTTTTRTTSELPVLALGQGEFVDRIQTWPEDKRPFWWTNRNQIAAHLNPTNMQQDVVRPNVQARSFFAGK